jgi:DNA replication factor GINS
MNVEELRTVQRTERQKDSLQHLRDSFYRDVAEYVAERKAERQRVASEADDPFSSPEVSRLSDEIGTAEEVVESIYERRVGKIVKRATFAAAGMATEDEGLTTEERDLFEDLVDRIEENRRTVLDDLVGDVDAGDAGVGEAAGAEADPTPAADADANADAGADPTPPDPDDLLAEAMGGDGGADGSVAPDDDGGGVPAAAATGASGDRSDAGATGRGIEESSDATPDPDPEPEPASPPADGPATDGGDAVAPPDTDRTTLRITRDVGEILGVDERAYDLASEDVVTLPTANAEPLLDRDAAERLE